MSQKILNQSKIIEKDINSNHLITQYYQNLDDNHEMTVQQRYNSCIIKKFSVSDDFYVTKQQFLSSSETNNNQNQQNNQNIQQRVQYSALQTHSFSVLQPHL